LLSGGPLGVRTAVGRVAFFTSGYRIPEYAGQEFLPTCREESAIPLFLNDYKLGHTKQEIHKRNMKNAQIPLAQEGLPAHA
jgi:hypothetical protein